MLILLVGAVLSLILAGFFSAVEMAYLSVNRLYFELHGRQGPVGEKLVSQFLRNPVLFIGTTLMGNTLFLVLYAVLGVTLLNPVLMAYIPDAYDSPFLLVVIETLVLTLIFLPLADYLPKSLALIHPDRFLEWLAVPLWVIYKAIAPVVGGLVSVARFVIRQADRHARPDIRPVFGLTDLNQYLQTLNQKPQSDTDETEQTDVATVDAQIFTNAIAFRDVRVRDCMIPRTDIAAVAINDSLSELQQAFQDSGHSKIVIYRDSIDDVLGYCHALALFQRPTSISSILTPMITVPETMPAQDLLRRFLTERKSLAVVVDEFGGTAGLVSVEDMVEQIFGEIQDEYDTNEDWVERQLNPHTWMLSARHEIEYLNKKHGWQLPEGDYDTLGGLILAIHKELPTEGERISVPPFLIIIESMDETRIDTVQLIVNSEE